MNKETLPMKIIDRLIEDAKRLRYGTVSVVLKIHEGNVVAVSHEITETTRTTYKQEVVK
jgi:hypothetical protein